MIPTDPSQITLDKMIDVTAAAKEMGVSSQYLRNLINRGAVEHVRIGHHVVVWRPSMEQYMETHAQIPEGALSPAQAAEELGVSTQTVFNWIQKGYLPANSVPSGKRLRWFINRSDLAGKGKPKPDQPEQLTLFDVSDYDNDKALHPVE